MTATTQPGNASELLPCPFCGTSDSFVEREDFTSAYVQCDHCMARGPIGCQESDDEELPGKLEAELSWNTRTTPAAEGREALELKVAQDAATQPGIAEWLRRLATRRRSAFGEEGMIGCRFEEAAVEIERLRGCGMQTVDAMREALVLAEDVLSRAPFSTDIWPNGMHPQRGIKQIRAALALPSAGVQTAGDALEDLVSTFEQMRGYPEGDSNDPCFDLCGVPCCDEFGCLHAKVRVVRALAVSSAGAQTVDADLVQRCRELLEWSATGLLAGGNGGAVRALADRLKEDIGDTYALRVAERQTKDDAMRTIVALASPLSSAIPPIKSRADREGGWSAERSLSATSDRHKDAENERIARLQYEAGMYKSLYENAIEQCAIVAEGFAAASNSPRMKLFEEAGLVLAIYERDGEIGAAIRTLKDFPLSSAGGA